MCFTHSYPLKLDRRKRTDIQEAELPPDYQVVLGQSSAATVRWGTVWVLIRQDLTCPLRHYERSMPGSCSLAIWKLERKRSVQRDYGVPNQGFGRYSIKALQQDQELDWAWSASVQGRSEERRVG